MGVEPPSSEGYPRASGFGNLTRDQAAEAAAAAAHNKPQHDVHAAARQTIWAQALNPSHQTGAIPTNDTFVHVEAPEQTMTKAFTPHGLLSAGLQDKHDRSAKRQEELARETGASLLSVANKPPPPQTGLLGAITAHERERKREGGFGAALTERERDKRLAEERQRKLDEFQRQQLEMAQSGGSMYGGGYMNPMMGMGGMMPMNPMMTGMGMNPMMMGGMMPGLSPQHMFAAQQAAQAAYQQAMMAFSMAGSQAGGDGPSPGGTPNPGMQGGMSPMMTGMGGMSNMGGMGMMGGFDPRMSMMGMPYMGGMGMGGMGGMGPMTPGMSPMGMQMTGNFGQFDANLRPPGGDGNGRIPSPVSASGSPGLRPTDPGEGSVPAPGQASGTTSPRGQTPAT
jgi:CCR4-NOT transcriptional complex subunit CAF120